MLTHIKKYTYRQPITKYLYYNLHIHTHTYPNSDIQPGAPAEAGQLGDTRHTPAPVIGPTMAQHPQRITRLLCGRKSVASKREMMEERRNLE